MSFQAVRIATTATVSVSPAYIITARLKAGAAAGTLSLYNNTTAAANRIAILSCAAANTVDELRIPVRAKSGTVKAVMSAVTLEGWVYVE